MITSIGLSINDSSSTIPPLLQEALDPTWRTPGCTAEYVQRVSLRPLIGAVQLVGGALLLANRYVPLALTLLGPVIVNILLYHLLLSHTGAG
jgi:hypothetical protein